MIAQNKNFVQYRGYTKEEVLIIMDDVPVLVLDYLSYMQTIRGKSNNTIKEYYYDLRRFLRFTKLHKKLVSNNIEFDKIDITDLDMDFIRKISLSDFYAYMSYLSNNANKVSSRARKVASIKSFFNYLCNKAKLIDINPAKDLESPKLEKRQPKHLNLDESLSLLNTIEGKDAKRDYAIITLFLNCGLRLAELIGINISRIKDNTLTVIGKGNKERTVYLNNACINAIEDYLKERPKNAIKDKDALFLSERKQRISRRTVQYIVEKYLKLAGLDQTRYSAHKLRHTAATLMYQYGNVDIRSLQEILGHESVATTEIYTHIDKKQLREAVDSNPLANVTKSD